LHTSGIPLQQPHCLVSQSYSSTLLNQPDHSPCVVEFLLPLTAFCELQLHLHSAMLVVHWLLVHHPVYFQPVFVTLNSYPKNRIEEADIKFLIFLMLGWQME
jgi:hypothetical protein